LHIYVIKDIGGAAVIRNDENAASENQTSMITMVGHASHKPCGCAAGQSRRNV
jgi:hypothetical protein